MKADVNCCQQEQRTFSATTNYSFPDSVIRGPAGNQLTSTATYKAATGQVATSTDENGKVTTFTYDTMKRLTDVQRPDSQHVTVTYDDVAHTARVTSPVQGTNVSRQTTSVDGLGRPIKQQTTDGAGTSYSITETQYDSWQRAFKVSTPHNSTAQYWTETRFDALARPILVIPPDGNPTSNRWTYSYPLNAAIATDPTGKQRKTQTDALGRITKVFEPDVSTGVLNVETDYAYTALDGLLTVTQGAQTRNYTYDDLGRTLTAKIPETNQMPTSFQYDPTFPNLLTQRTDPRGVITTYGYDTLNRLHQISYNVGATGVPTTPAVTLDYGINSASNNNGRLLTMTDGVGSGTYSYDAMGRVTQVQRVNNAKTYTLGYSYNFAGEAISFTYPSGHIVQQSFDTIGRLCEIAPSTTGCSTAATKYATGLAYNQAFELTGLTYGNGMTTTLSYTPERLQLNSLNHKNSSGTSMFQLTYGYTQNGGNNGQITSVANPAQVGQSVNYVYDALGRLSSAISIGSTSYPKWGLSWVYDRYGNRASESIAAGCVAPMTCPTNSVSISVTTNRITGSPYNYDANGNMTNDGSNILTYDAENRIVSATNGTSSGSYSYDGDGTRVKKVWGLLLQSTYSPEIRSLQSMITTL